MTYNEFVETLRQDFPAHTGVPEEQLQFYPDGWRGSGDLKDNEFIQSTNHFYQKDAADCLLGDYLVIQENDSEFGRLCRFSIEYLYDEYQDKGWERVWYIIDENLKLRSRCSIEEIFGEGVHYEAVKSKLIIRPLNFTDNQFELRNASYRRIGDMALVLYAIGYSEGDMLTTVKVPKDFPEKWGTDADTAFEEALLNTFITRPPRLYFTHRECMSPPYERGAFMALGADYHIAGPAVSPVLTTWPNTNGAIAFFYPGVREKLAEVMGGSYYIAFTSIHEAHLHLKGSKRPRDILHRLKSVNKAFDPNEILTRKVYLYDADKASLDAVEL